MNIIEHLMSILDLDVEERGIVPLSNDALLRMLGAAERSANLYHNKQSPSSNIQGDTISETTRLQDWKTDDNLINKITEVAKEGTKDEGYHTPKTYTRGETANLCIEAYRAGAIAYSTIYLSPSLLEKEAFSWNKVNLKK